MHHEIVVLPADNRARGTGDRRAGDDLMQVGVDISATPTGFVDGRRAEFGQTSQLLGASHSAATTCGVTR
jgi:hypothetical protein